MLLLLPFLSLLGSVFALTHNIQTIAAIGSKFFYEDGTQYFLKGMSNKCQKTTLTLQEWLTNSRPTIPWSTPSNANSTSLACPSSA